MKHRAFAILFICTILSCSKKSSQTDTITVSILPQKYFAERITGGSYKIFVMTPWGQNPESYEPTLKQMKEIGSSFIYFKVGYLPFELTQVDKIEAANPSMKIVNTSEGIELIEDEHTHGHGSIDPHIWLSPRAAKTMALNMLNALSAAVPEHSSMFAKNYGALEADIVSVSKKIEDSLKTTSHKTFICFHPAWAYFARDYELKQIAIESDGKEPSPAGIKKIIDTAKKENIRTIFVQKEFPADIAQAIAKDIGGKIIQLDPLAENWLEMMNLLSNTLAKELKAENKIKN